MNVRLIQGECLAAMAKLPDRCVDMVLCDMPYGTTQNKWDSVIDLQEMWKQYARLCTGAVVLTAAQPFTSVLVCSNLKKFKYSWVWEKEKGTGHLNAKKQPMRSVEDVVVFYTGQPVYNPQMEVGTPYNGNARIGGKQQTSNYGGYNPVRNDNEGFRYPKQVIRINSVGRGGVHPTQKPVTLMEYLIRTYTNEGMTVLDNCMGSGTTGVACKNLNRNFIGIELDPLYFQLAKNRINATKWGAQ